MKVNKVIVNILVVLVIVLISVISFLGINVIRKNVVTNLIPDYKFGIDLTANRNIRLSVDESEVTKETNQNELEEITTDGTEVNNEEEKTGELVNPQEVRTVENYYNSKDIIVKRLEQLGEEQYSIKLNEENGFMDIQLVEDSDVTTIIQSIAAQGKMELIDSETNEVILSNDNIKGAKVGYSNSSDKGTYVGLVIEFNEDCKDKFKEITENHPVTKDDEGNDNSKKVKLNLDGQTLIETAFESAIEDGQFQMSIGQPSNDENVIKKNTKNANQMAVFINTGKMPVKYTVEINRYMTSDFEIESVSIVCALIGIVALVAIVVLFIVNPHLGLKNTILLVGFVAAYFLLMRYTDIIISLESIVAFLFVVGMQYLFNVKAAKMAKEEQAGNVITTLLKKNALRIMPLYVLLIVCAFSEWQSIFSVGIIMFWGFALMLIYNLIFTNILYANSKK